MTTSAAPSTASMLAAAPHRIASVSLLVRDLEQVTGFYRERIGLDILQEADGEARLGVAGRELLRLRHVPDARERDARDAGLFHTAFLLPSRADLGAWLAHARARGIELTGAADHTVSEAVYLCDPEGNGIEIYVDRPAERWPAENGRIPMANDRLDFAGIAAAGAGRTWTGMPGGATVGHVHLQVGDTAAAEAFYGGLLGFAVTCRYPGASFFGSGGYHHQLAANSWNSRGAGRRPGGAAGLSEVAIAVEPAAFDALRTAIDRSRTAASIGEDVVAVDDPWGTRISLRRD